MYTVKKPKIEKMPYFSNEKDIAKVPTDLNSRSLETQLVNFHEKQRQKIVSGVGVLTFND